MKREVAIATGWGVLLTCILAGLIVLGSRDLQHFDAALVGYTFAVLFAVFGITYRYAMWLQRPPTAMYWRRGWQVFFSRKYIAGNLRRWISRVFSDVALNRFIWRRGRHRWAAHWFIMWGCILAVAITFPLVFGWVHFESVPGRLGWYRAYNFGVPIYDFPIHSALAFVVFHGLDWAAVLVILGVMLAMRRRMRETGAAALQDFGEDFLPLILLFAVSLTGLMLTCSYTWMKGYGYDFLAILHAVTVIFTLLWLPFGKFFHIFQHPAQLGVSFYKDAGSREEPAECGRCGQPFTSRLHVEDLIRVEQELGYRYDLPDTPQKHYQWICPRCRRALLTLAQEGLWRIPVIDDEEEIFTDGTTTSPTTFVNPAIGKGPLGEEDKANFHP